MRECLSCERLTNNPKYCCLSCANRMQRLNAPKKNKDKICLNCGETFQYNADPHQKFCGHRCSAIYHSEKGTRKTRPGTPASQKGKPCQGCGTPLTGTSSKYCSRACAPKKRKAANIEAWLKDPSTGNTKQGLKTSIRSYLLDEAGHKCSLCGWNKVHPVTGKIPLEIDHMDGDCYNNAPENLRVLCPSCHSLTATYGASNRNGQRAYRRKEYLDARTGQKKPAKVYTPHLCLACGKKVSRGSKKCISCYTPPLKIVWPSLEEIEKRLETSSFAALGRELGVTDNAIRKYIKRMKFAE